MSDARGRRGVGEDSFDYWQQLVAKRSRSLGERTEKGADEDKPGRKEDPWAASGDAPERRCFPPPRHVGHDAAGSISFLPATTNCSLHYERREPVFVADEELERVDLVHERCFESGLEDFQVMSDMIAYFEAGGVLSGSHHPLWDRGGGGGAS